MLNQPRSTLLNHRFRFSNKKHIFNSSYDNYSLCIKTTKQIKLFWNNFESLRLHLIWILGKKRRYTRKMYYKQIKGHQKKEFFTMFKKSKFQMHEFLFFGFPHLPFTRKAKGSRMGKGKGSSSGYYFNCVAGETLLCVNARNFFMSKKIAKKINFILPKHKSFCLFNSIFFTVKYM